MRQVISHSIVAATCLAVGFLYRGVNNKDLASYKEPVVATANLSEPTSESTTAMDSEEQLAAIEYTVVQSVDDIDNNAIQTDISEELLTLDMSNTDQTPSGTGLNILTDVDIEQLHSGEMESVNEAFTEWFNGSEDPGREIMEFLLSQETSTEEKHVMEYLLGSNTAMRTLAGLDKSIVNQLGLATPDDAELWENILDTVSVRSDGARRQLLETLPNITDERLVSASLLAIKPDYLAPSERSELLTEISTYTESDSEDIKTAAIMSIGQWSGHGYTYVVEDMLTNGTENEKNAALIATSSGKFWSEQIHHQAVSTLNDESVPEELRMNAFLALSNRPLDDQSYAEVHKFYQQYILPLQTVTQ